LVWSGSVGDKDLPERNTTCVMTPTTPCELETSNFLAKALDSRIIGGVNAHTALSFREMPRFDVPGEIQRCDWLKITHSLDIHTGHMQTNASFDQSQRCTVFPRYIKPQNIFQTTVQCEQQWLTPPCTGNSLCIDQRSFGTQRSALRDDAFDLRFTRGVPKETSASTPVDAHIHAAQRYLVVCRAARGAYQNRLSPQAP